MDEQVEQFLNRFCLSLLLIVFAGSVFGQKKDKSLQRKFWKKQALNAIIKPWTTHAVDKKGGGFHTHLDREWRVDSTKTTKYPGMQARHLFSYSVAYLMSGKKKFLEQARQTVQFLIRNGWDDTYGGWYNAIDQSGRVVDSTKDLFMQTYAVTGLTMYFLVTHEERILNYIERSNKILQQYAWDGKHGGYYRALNRDLSVKNDRKDFTPQLAPVSGYLLYLYIGTRDSTYMNVMERSMDIVLNKMQASSKNWILERFDRKWHPDRKKNKQVNVGHNIETAWLLLRLFQLNEKENYKAQAFALRDQLIRYAFDTSTGVWIDQVQRKTPARSDTTSTWWVQAYGNMFMLYNYHITGDDKYLRYYKKGVRFWNENFVDDEYGGTVLKVTNDGSIVNGAKATKSKTSYHAMEHALLNYIYSALWVNKQPVTFYYAFDARNQTRKLFPLFIEDPDVNIKKLKVRSKKDISITFFK